MMRQRQILQQIATDIVAKVDLPWKHLSFRSTETAPYSELGTYVTKLDGDVVLKSPPRDISNEVNELRDLMYQPGTGTWFTMWIEITDGGQVSSRFDYDNEPDWSQPADPLIYFEDLQKYPRDPEHTPVWLAEQVTLGKADFDRHHHPDGTPRR